MSSPMPPQGQPQVQKKTSIWVWILGGIAIFLFAITLTCGVIGYMGVKMIKNAGFDSQLMKDNPAYAAAKMVVTMNPELEVVKSNDSAGTMVVREKSTGKLTTMKFDPVAKKMVISTDDGKQSTVTLGDNGITAQSSDGSSMKIGAAASGAPSWVPVYPGSSPQGTLSTNTPDGSQNTFTFKTPDSSAKILAYYTDQLKTSGFTISLTSTTDAGGILRAEDQDKKRTIMITASADGSSTAGSITAIEKK